MRKAFTMIELVFVIAVIGILAAVAIPKLAVTRNDAVIVSAKSTIAAVKASLATQRQMMILRGNFTAIDSLNKAGGAFSTFGAGGIELKDAQGVAIPVLEGTIPLCETGKSGCWESGTSYVMPNGSKVGFALTSGKFDCTDTTSAGCKALTQ